MILRPHPRFTVARFRAIQEVEEGRVTYWHGMISENEHRDNWIVDGQRVNPTVYNWLREQDLVKRVPGAGQPHAMMLTPRGREALDRETIRTREVPVP